MPLVYLRVCREMLWSSLGIVCLFFGLQLWPWDLARDGLIHCAWCFCDVNFGCEVADGVCRGFLLIVIIFVLDPFCQ